MNITGDYEKLLENDLREELTWLEEELKILFNSKKDKCTKHDVSLGSKILDNVIENIKNNRSEALLNLLAITLNRIEQTYPFLF